MKELEFKSIRLRALEPEDVDLLYSWENNLETWEVSNTLAPFSKYVLAQFIEQSTRDIYENKQLRLIIENTKGTPVGAIDLFDFEPYHLRAGVGILVHSTDQRGKGYATDALELLCHYAKHTLGLHQLYANIAADNKASIHLFEKCKFALSGVKKDWLKNGQQWKDELIYQRLLF